MAFEIFTRKIQRVGSPTASLTKMGRLALNKAATSKLEGDAVENALLLWDKDRRIIGIRPITKKDDRSYKINYDKKGGGSGFSAKTFFDYIGYDYTETRTLPAKWNEQEMAFLIEVPEAHLKAERSQTKPILLERAGRPRKT
jgi:hypothetical protein